MNILDTRDLIEKRDELKQNILDSFHETFEHYIEMTENYEDILMEEEEIQSWKEDWIDEITEIEEINNIEDEVGSEFTYGESLICEDYFEEYCEDMVKDLGYLPNDIPGFLYHNIDWKGVASDLGQDYSIVEYQGRNYYYRMS